VGFRININTNSLECTGSKTEVAIVNLWLELEGFKNKDILDYSKISEYLNNRKSSSDILFADE